MNTTNEEAIRSINFEKILSTIFIIVGLVNIYGDKLLIDSIRTGNELPRKRASNIFLFGLIVAYIIYIIIVSRNYTFYIDKKNSGEDATLELTRLFGSVLILAGFTMIFYYFIKIEFDTSNTPVV